MPQDFCQPFLFCFLQSCKSLRSFPCKKIRLVLAALCAANKKPRPFDTLKAGGWDGAFGFLERGLFLVNVAFLIVGVEQLVSFVAHRLAQIVLVDLGDHRVVV